ncbi:MAG TPA: hypothetical protein VG034_20380 [Acidimicrobiia bacterium]|nr:hypothetical protein [Acidimicrobiia bacterium]
MLIRSRSARFAALALAFTTPLVAANALPAFADGESASATLTSPASGSATTFTWNYTFEQNGGNGLSNIAVGFCSADILSDVVSADPSADIFADGDVVGGHDGFGPGIKFGVTATTGTLTVTFGHAHSISDNGLRIQSHSGGGQTGDATKTTKGPGPCPSDPSDNTGGDDTGDNTGGDNSGGDNSGGDNSGGGNTGGDNSGGGNTAGTTGTEVLGVTLDNNDGGTGSGTNSGTQTAPSPAEPASVPQVSPPTGTTVSGNDLAAGAELPRTGANVHFLVTLAFSLMLAGLALRAAFSRRIRSASSPG